jgi:hypothetical protein
LREGVTGKVRKKYERGMWDFRKKSMLGIKRETTDANGKRDEKKKRGVEERVEFEKVSRLREKNTEGENDSQGKGEVGARMKFCEIFG